MEDSDQSNETPDSEERGDSNNEQLFVELFDRLSEAEQRLDLVERQRNTEALRRYQAESDLGAQIQQVNEYMRLYHEEWTKRKSVEAELKRCQAERETLRKRYEELKIATEYDTVEKSESPTEDQTVEKPENLTEDQNVEKPKNPREDQPESSKRNENDL